MRHLLRTSLSSLTVLAVLATGVPARADQPYDVLVFTKTTVYRHDSIPAGIRAVQDLGAANAFTVTATEDAAAFTPDNLARYEAVVFLNTTGDVLDDDQQNAFESYIRGGGGFAGVHAAADTEYDWPFYGRLVGSYFASHADVQPATLAVTDRAHAATADLPRTWTRTDEWYDYRTDPSGTAHVLINRDGQPQTWCQTVDAGRSFYTGGGHTIESYADDAFRGLLLGGIRYAAGRTHADCRAETGYTTLYDGSTAGWSQAGPGGFTEADATLTSYGGLGLLWYTPTSYTDYSLKLDWRVDGDDNSGVFVGFPPTDDPWLAAARGYEVQIDATDSPDKTTGAVYGYQQADLAARDAALNPPGAWNTYELLVQGARLRVYLNGVQINDFTATDPARSLAGHVGIQNHGDGDSVSFRNIRIKDLGGVTVQAEQYGDAYGVGPFGKEGAAGGHTLGFVDPGDWAAYRGLDLTGVTAIRARVVSGGPGGTIQVRTGSPDGPVLGSVAVPNTGGWTTYAEVTATLSGVPSGTADLYLTFDGSGSGLFDVDEFTLRR